MLEGCSQTGGLLRPPKVGRPLLSEGGAGCVFGPCSTQPAGSSRGVVTEGVRAGIRELQNDVPLLALHFPRGSDIASTSLALKWE